MDITEMRVIDDISRSEWSELIGTEIQGDHVRITREFYEKHAAEIQAIQMSAGFRYKMKQEMM